MRNTLRASQHGVNKLLGLEVCVARHVLEPLRRIARCVLDLQNLNATHFLVVLQALFNVVVLGHQASVQFNRVFQSQLGTRTD